MPNTYLTVTFKDKDAAKALGAKWDAVKRQWFVPDGRELAPFSAWLPAGSATGIASTATELTAPSSIGTELTIRKQGVSLSQRLAGVSQAVAQAYKTGVWTLVEVAELRASNLVGNNQARRGMSWPSAMSSAKTWPPY
jgi:exodeoxyribonuclease VII large subunit